MNKILLLHGALGSDHQTQKLFESLQTDHNVIRMEFHGHGKKASGDCAFDLDMLADQLLEFIREHDLIGVDVFGYSMGGYVATIAAGKEAEMIGKIITLGTKWRWDPESTDAEISKLNPDIISDKVPNFANYHSMQHGEDNWRDLLHATSDMMIGLGKQGRALAVEYLNNINNPFLVLRGENDNMVSREESIWATECFGNAEYREVTSQPHPLEKVDPESLKPLVNDFFSH